MCKRCNFELQLTAKEALNEGCTNLFTDELTGSGAAGKAMNVSRSHNDQHFIGARNM